MDHGVVMRRHELTDAEWEALAPLIPSADRGRSFRGTQGHQRKGLQGTDRGFLAGRAGTLRQVEVGLHPLPHYAIDGVFTRALRQIQAQADALVTSTGWSRSIPPSSAPTSMPPTRGETVAVKSNETSLRL